MVVSQLPADRGERVALLVELDSLPCLSLSHRLVAEWNAMPMDESEDGAFAKVVLAGQLRGWDAGLVVPQELLDSVGGEAAADGMNPRMSDRIRSSSGGVT